MPRLTRYAQLGSTRKAQSETVLSFGELHGDKIVLRDPEANNGYQTLNIRPWGRWPELAEAFSAGLIIWATGKASRTRLNMVRSLNTGWFRFLEAAGGPSTFRITDITTSRTNQFIVWLNQARVDGSEHLHVTTRHDHYCSLRAIIRALHSHRVWRSALHPELIMRPSPWVGLSRHSRPAEPIPFPHIRKLFRACISEVKEIKTKFNSDWELIKNRTATLPEHPTSQADYYELHTALAELDRLFRNAIPARQSIFAANPHLDNAIVSKHSYTRIAFPFHPRQRLLVPFILLLAIYFKANASLLLQAERSDFVEEEVHGSRRLVWRRFKPRSHATMRRSYAYSESSDHPVQLLRFMDTWTRRIRPIASSKFRDRVFLFVPEGGSPKKVTSFTDLHAHCAWDHNLRKFLNEHAIQGITLQRIRVTGIDLIRQLFNGDIRAAATAAGHTNINTTDAHYTSGAERMRSDETVASVVELRSRWIDSRGRIDPRRTPSNDDKGAATPGWRCLDPFESPILGQTKGRLCCAYGLCPTCPLAQVDTSSAYALARIYQLRSSVEAAQHQVPPQRWLSVWAPVLTAIDRHWLPAFTEVGVRERASNISLSPLAPIE